LKRAAEETEGFHLMRSGRLRLRLLCNHTTPVSLRWMKMAEVAGTGVLEEDLPSEEQLRAKPPCRGLARA